MVDSGISARWTRQGAFETEEVLRHVAAKVDVNEKGRASRGGEAMTGHDAWLEVLREQAVGKVGHPPTQNQAILHPQ